jgi:hypothetical protein
VSSKSLAGFEQVAFLFTSSQSATLAVAGMAPRIEHSKILAVDQNEPPSALALQQARGRGNPAVLASYNQ